MTSRPLHTAVLAVTVWVVFAWGCTPPVHQKPLRPDPALAPVRISATADASMEGGPTEPCSDAIALSPLEGRFDLRRTGSASSALVVRYAVRGSAVPNRAYDALSGVVRFTPGSAVTTVPVVPRPAGRPGTVVLELLALPAYELGRPAVGTVSVKRSFSSSGCGPPVLGDTSSWSSQRIELGGAPAPFPMTPLPGALALAYLASGSLPPGIALVSDGTFTGAASTLGSYEAVLGSCTPAQALPPAPRTGPQCVQAPLQVDVVAHIAAAPPTPVATPDAPDTPRETRSSTRPVVTLLDGGRAAAWQSDDRECSHMSSAGVQASRVRVHRAGSLEAPLAVTLGAAGTARTGVDYEPIDPVVVIPAGQSEAIIRVVPRWEAVVPPIHEHRTAVLVVTLRAEQGYVIGAPATAVVPMTFDRAVFGCPENVGATGVDDPNATGNGSGGFSMST